MMVIGKPHLKVAGKLFFMPLGSIDVASGRRTKDLPDGSNSIHDGTAVIGVVYGLPKLPFDCNVQEMWEGEFVFIPHDRYRDTKGLFTGMGLAGVITSGLYADGENYGEHVEGDEGLQLDFDFV